MKSFASFIIVSLFVGSAFASDSNYIPSVLPPKEELMKVQKDDVVIGCDEAQNIIIEYSSLACPHCADYYTTVFPKIKSELVNTCKVKYVYREFPTTRSALKASAMVKCISIDDEKKLDSEKFMHLTQTLFRSQSSWAFSYDYEKKLTSIIGLTGVPQDRLSACLNDKESATTIAASSFVSMKVLELSHSPSIFVNGVETGIPTFESISGTLKK